MPIFHYGGGGDGGGGGSNYLVPHSELISGGATWHWHLDDDAGVEAVVGGGALDLTGTQVYQYGGPGIEMGNLDAARSLNVETGAIGAAIRIQGAITIGAWVRAKGVQAGNGSICGVRIAGAGEANNIQWELGFSNTGNKIRWIHQNGAADNSNIIEASVALGIDTWEHWTATRNAAGTIVKLYKNGVLDATSGTLIQATGGTNITKISVGNNAGSTEFNGNIFSPIVYEEEFSAAQVLELYNSTASTGAW